VIKMYGSTGSGQDVTGDETFTLEEMTADVEAARAMGKRIAIHTYGPRGARDVGFSRRHRLKPMLQAKARTTKGGRVIP
jgi:hypothetical protein